MICLEKSKLFAVGQVATVVSKGESTSLSVQYYKAVQLGRGEKFKKWGDEEMCEASLLYQKINAVPEFKGPIIVFRKTIDVTDEINIK